jgi:hypothetical protein
MRVVPGSGIENRKLRKSKVNLFNINNRKTSVHFPEESLVSELEAKSEQVYGKAGTVFLHDTDAWHGATELKDGYERYIYRSHTRTYSFLYPFV